MSGREGCGWMLLQNGISFCSNYVKVIDFNCCQFLSGIVCVLWTPWASKFDQFFGGKEKNEKKRFVCLFVASICLNMSNSSLLRHDGNMGWASAYDRSRFLAPLLSVTKFNMHKPLTNTEANKMDLFLQNKGIIIIAWRSVPAKLCLPVKLISEAVQSNKFGKWKCNSIHDTLYSLNIVTLYYVPGLFSSGGSLVSKPSFFT